MLRGFARAFEAELLPALRAIVKQAPFRHLITPGGHRMSVAMTNCGSVGWVSDDAGYRYDAIDPESGQPWPAMPTVLRRLAADAADDAGFKDFTPEACLINRYVSGAKLSLHQDKDELDSPRRSCRCRWGCPRSSCSAAQSAPTSRTVTGWSMATSWSGRPVATVLSRRCPARRRRTCSHGPPAHQPDFPQSAVIFLSFSLCGRRCLRGTRRRMRDLSPRRQTPHPSRCRFASAIHFLPQGGEGKTCSMSRCSSPGE